MLKFVRDALLDAAAITPEANLSYNVTITTGNAISIAVCDEDQRNWFHVKASRFIDLGSDFGRYKLARERFPTCTPDVVGHVRLGGWSILVTRSINHRFVQTRDLVGKPDESKPVCDIVNFFERARTLAALDGRQVGHEPFLGELRAYFAAPAVANAKVVSFLDKLAPEDLLDIPAIPQHGDFVLNNVGIAKGRLFIFDWEDYGEIKLAGFDIYMMSMSLAGMSATSVVKIQHTGDPSQCPWEFARYACAASALSYEIFRRMAPTYLIVFRYLKRNYGAEIRAQVDGILDQVLP